MLVLCFELQYNTQNVSIIVINALIKWTFFYNWLSRTLRFLINHRLELMTSTPLNYVCYSYTEWTMNSKVGLLFGHFFKGSLKKQTTLLLVLLWTLCKYSFIIQAHRISAARQITTMWTVRIWLWKEILTPILNVTSADYTINFNFCCLTLPCFPKQSVMVKCFHLQNLRKLICVLVFAR